MANSAFRSSRARKNCFSMPSEFVSIHVINIDSSARVGTEASPSLLQMPRTPDGPNIGGPAGLCLPAPHPFVQAYPHQHSRRGECECWCVKGCWQRVSAAQRLGHLGGAGGLTRKFSRSSITHNQACMMITLLQSAFADCPGCSESFGRPGSWCWWCCCVLASHGPGSSAVGVVVDTFA